MNKYSWYDIRNNSVQEQICTGEIPRGLKPIALHRHTGAVLYGVESERRAASTLPNYEAYTQAKYKLRRKFCDSALGMLMIDHPRFTEQALNMVIEGIKRYIHTIPPADWSAQANNRPFADQVGRHMGNAASFGRPGAVEPPNQTTFRGAIPTPYFIQGDSLQNITRWLGVLNRSKKAGDIPKIMSLCDVFFDVYVTLESRKGGGVLGAPRDEATRLGWRQAWFDKNTTRGRTSRGNNIPTTSAPGIIPWSNYNWGIDALVRAGVANTGLSNYASGGAFRMERLRGNDQFMIDENNLKGDYLADLKKFLLNFSASASGTTSTLIASANSFNADIIMNMETLKQYVMACVAYLVGGGMHTCHEVFYTASLKKAKLYYTPGLYNPMLPQSFKTSREYTKWRLEFWDVVENREFPAQ